jgi:predicted DsbA family dithiol-disulfide isomerase
MRVERSTPACYGRAMDSLATPVAVIDVVSDVVCPFCWIGKRQLDAMLAELPEAERPAVRWHPFRLDPTLPAEGVDRRERMERKFGGPEGVAQAYDNVRAYGRTVGLSFEFERVALQPNTLDAHRLIAWAQSQRDPDALVEALFRGYFVEGRFLGDRATLAAIAGEAGFDAAAARAFLDSDALADEVAAADENARQAGVRGVPFFVFGDRVAVSGAQGTAALGRALERARDRNAATTGAAGAG